MSIESRVSKSINYNEMFFVTINGYTNYKINPDGVVKNIKTNKELKPHLNKNGYYYVNLYENRIRKHKPIHQLVANAFLTKPNEKCVVDHINNDRTDNRLENLRFVSCNENTRNRLKNASVNYKFVNEIPTNSLHITFIKDNDITNIGLYFNKQSNEFYIKMTDNKYRIMNKNPNKKSYFIQFRFNGKIITYSPKQLKRDYTDYFN